MKRRRRRRKADPSEKYIFAITERREEIQPIPKPSESYVIEPVARRSRSTFSTEIHGTGTSSEQECLTKVKGEYILMEFLKFLFIQCFIIHSKWHSSRSFRLLAIMIFSKAMRYSKPWFLLKDRLKYKNFKNQGSAN